MEESCFSKTNVISIHLNGIIMKAVVDGYLWADPPKLDLIKFAEQNVALLQTAHWGSLCKCLKADITQNKQR